MAFFRTRVPYQYREFRDCPRATYIDRCTHEPLTCAVLGILLAVAHGAVAVLLYNASGHGKGFVGVIAGILLFAAFVWLLFGALIIPKLSSHFDWAGKIARKEAAKGSKE